MSARLVRREPGHAHVQINLLEAGNKRDDLKATSDVNKREERASAHAHEERRAAQHID